MVKRDLLKQHLYRYVIKVPEKVLENGRDSQREREIVFIAAALKFFGV